MTREWSSMGEQKRQHEFNLLCHQKKLHSNFNFQFYFNFYLNET